MFSRLVLSSFILACGVYAHADATPPLSSSIGTDQLESFFSVSPSDGNPATVDVGAAFQKVYASNGVGVEAPLTTSTEDVVTFSTEDGSSSVVFNPNNGAGNVLPLKDGGNYNVTLTRASGESFKATTTLPVAVTQASPVPGEIPKKSDPVHVSWKPALAGVWQAQVQTNCTNTNGDISAGDDGASIEIPAGWVSQCPGRVDVEVDVVFINGGTGYGSFSGVGSLTVNFTYDTASLAGGSLPVPKSIVKKLLQQKGSKHILVSRKL